MVNRAIIKRRIRNLVCSIFGSFLLWQLWGKNDLLFSISALVSSTHTSHLVIWLIQFTFYLLETLFFENNCIVYLINCLCHFVSQPISFTIWIIYHRNKTNYFSTLHFSACFYMDPCYNRPPPFPRVAMLMKTPVCDKVE